MGENNGFLTSTDKEFLQADGEYYTGENAKQSRYERRKAIAERARQAFHDFRLLYETLDEDERNRIFDIEPQGRRSINGERTYPSPAHPFYKDLIGSVAFLYLALEGELGSSLTRERWFSISFERVLQQAIKAGEQKRYGRQVIVEVGELDVDVRTDIDAGTTEAAVDKLARGDYHTLTESEMFSVLFSFGEMHGEESYDRLTALIKERREELGIDREEPLDIKSMFSDGDDGEQS